MNPITGRAIFGGPPIGDFFTLGFGTEIIYSLIIIVCSLMIYFGTKELYELSSHRGIKYFRQAFLFFAIAYFFRSFIKFVLVYFNVNRILDISHRIFIPLFSYTTLFVFMYFSSMAIFYLLCSVMWKKWNGDSRKIYLLHLLALIIALFIILSNNVLVYLGVNFFLFFIVLFIVYISYKNKKKKTKGHKHNWYIIYLLLSFFWILNIVDILIPEFFQTFQLFIYIASLIIFLMMLYKVLKKVGSN